MAQHILKLGQPFPKILFCEEAQVFVPAGWVDGDIKVNGAKSVFVQPYVSDPRYGGGLRLVRDWEEGLGARPKVKSITVNGAKSVLLLHLEGDVTITDLKGAGEEEKATIGLKGLRGKVLKCDDWEQAVGTYDDIDFDEVDFGKDPEAKGFKDCQYNENTGKDGQPLKTSRWKVRHDPRPRKDGKGGRLAASTLGRMNLTGKSLSGKGGVS